MEIGGEAYWDGGYMGNPALFPFFDDTGSDDILLVQVNPIRREEVPKTASEIVERVSEVTFNSSLLREFRAIDFVNRLHEEHRLDPKKYRVNRLHRIDATKALRNYTAASKLDTSWHFFQELHHAGRKAAKDWLAAHFDDLGTGRRWICGRSSCERTAVVAGTCYYGGGRFSRPPYVASRANTTSSGSRRSLANHRSMGTPSRVVLARTLRPSLPLPNLAGWSSHRWPRRRRLPP